MTRILSTFLKKELRDRRNLYIWIRRETELRSIFDWRSCSLIYQLRENLSYRPPDEKPDGAGRLPKGILDELLRSGSRKCRSPNDA